jgi:molybdate transport system permease protein
VRSALSPPSARGLAGQYLADIGVHLPFHMTGAIVAETFVAMPFLVLTVESAFRTADQRYEDAGGRSVRRGSLSSGASRCRRSGPAHRGYSALLGAPGSSARRSRSRKHAGQDADVAALRLYHPRGPNSDAAIVLSLMLVAISLVVLVSLRDRWLTAV